MNTFKESRKRERLTGRSSDSATSKPGMALIPEEVMNSPVYIGLPLAARQLLTEISVQYRPGGLGNNGSLCLAWDAVFEARGWKRSTFYKQVKLLAESGFIIITRQGGNRLASYCALAWRDIAPPMKKVFAYDPHIVLGRSPHKPWIKSVADHPTLGASLARKFTAAAMKEAAAKKRGVATQPDDSETGCGATQLREKETRNGLPGSTVAPIQLQETGCHAAHYKNLCHGQGASAELKEVESSTVEAQRIAKAKAECPVFASPSNVIPLVIAERRKASIPASLPKRPGQANTQLEATKVEFGDLLVTGGITPMTAAKRIHEAIAQHGDVVAMEFMRQFVSRHGESIRATRKAQRTSGALAAAVRHFKPGRQVA